MVALREIAEETVNIEDLGEALIQGMQKHVEIDEPEEEPQDFEMAIVAMGGEETGELTVAVDALAVSDGDQAEKALEDGSGGQDGGSEDDEAEKT